MPTNLIIIGGGEHARVITEAALSRPDLWRVEGFTDLQPCALLKMLQIPHLGCDDALVALSERKGGCWAVLGVGGRGPNSRRRSIVESYQALNTLKWAAVVHAAAWISPTATIEEGAVVLAGAVVNSGAFLGPHSLVNTGAIIEHDVHVGQFAMVSTGATVGGGAFLEEDAFIGLGSCIRDHVTIGAAAMIGMGSVVVKNVAAGQIVAGVPARVLKSRHAND